MEMAQLSRQSGLNEMSTSALIGSLPGPRLQPALFRARLTEAGLAVEDTALLSQEYSRTADWPAVRQRALQENLLAKGSQARTLKLLRAVQRRVVEAQSPLDRPLLLARFLASRLSEAARAQLLFVLAAAEDVVFADQEVQRRADQEVQRS
jgi:hypothetical protein